MAKARFPKIFDDDARIHVHSLLACFADPVWKLRSRTNREGSSARRWRSASASWSRFGARRRRAHHRNKWASFAPPLRELHIFVPIGRPRVHALYR